MKRALLIVMVGLMRLAVMPAIGAAKPLPSAPAFDTLEPDGFRDVGQDLTVNVVVVGYEQGVGARDIEKERFWMVCRPRTQPSTGSRPTTQGKSFSG